jgi:hypothetical protein
MKEAFELTKQQSQSKLESAINQYLNFRDEICMALATTVKDIFERLKATNQQTVIKDSNIYLRNQLLVLVKFSETIDVDRVSR